MKASRRRREESLKRALKETILNLQRLAEEIERTLKRAEERLAEFDEAEDDE